MSAQRGNTSPYILIGILVVAALIIFMVLSNRNNQASSSTPVPTSGAEVPQQSNY